MNKRIVRGWSARVYTLHLTSISPLQCYRDINIRIEISPANAEISPRFEDSIECILLLPPLSLSFCQILLRRNCSYFLWSLEIVNRDTRTDHPLARQQLLRLDICDDCIAGHIAVAIQQLLRSRGGPLYLGFHRKRANVYISNCLTVYI